MRDIKLQKDANKRVIWTKISTSYLKEWDWCFNKAYMQLNMRQVKLISHKEL